MLSPATINFTICNGLAIYKGAEWSVPVTVSDRDVKEGNIKDTPVDLTGYTGRAAIKRYAGDDNPLAVPSVEITNPTEGQFLISLSAAETSALIVKGGDWKDVAVFQYDVYLDEATSGSSYRVLQGYVEVSPSVVDNTDHQE